MIKSPITPSALPIMLRLLLPLSTRACDAICDALPALLDDDAWDDPRSLNLRDCELIMMLSRIYDPRCANHAAHIRNNFRDNLDSSLII